MTTPPVLDYLDCDPAGLSPKFPDFDPPRRPSIIKLSRSPPPLHGSDPSNPLYELDFGAGGGYQSRRGSTYTQRSYYESRSEERFQNIQSSSKPPTVHTKPLTEKPIRRDSFFNPCSLANNSFNFDLPSAGTQGPKPASAIPSSATPTSATPFAAITFPRIPDHEEHWEDQPYQGVLVGDRKIVFADILGNRLPIPFDWASFTHVIGSRFHAQENTLFVEDFLRMFPLPIEEPMRRGTLHSLHRTARDMSEKAKLSRKEKRPSRIRRKHSAPEMKPKSLFSLRRSITGDDLNRTHPVIPPSLVAGSSSKPELKPSQKQLGYSPADIQETSRQWYEKYIQSGTRWELNLHSALQQRVERMVQEGYFMQEKHNTASSLEYLRQTWLPVYDHVDKMLRLDLFPKWLEIAVLDHNIRLSKLQATWWTKQDLTLKEFFSFPSPVDEADSRSHAFCIIILLSTSILLDAYFSIPFLSGIVSYGFIMRSLCGPRLDPQAFFVLFVLNSWFTQRLKIMSHKFVPGPPRRFSQCIGATLMILGTLARAAGGVFISWGFFGVLLACQLLSFMANICIGCHVFQAFMWAGLVPERICQECNTKFVTSL